MRSGQNTAPLQGKVAVVTGGNRGIGAAIASKLAELGAELVICGRRMPELTAVAESIARAGGRCHPVACDVTDLGSVSDLAKEVDKLGRIDVLVNNAGIAAFDRPLHELSPEDWDKVMNTNLRGVYYTIRAFAP